jgi:hypothetical protein
MLRLSCPCFCKSLGHNHSTSFTNLFAAKLNRVSRYPVLLAVDDFQALYCKTAYRDPHFVPIKPYHLSIPRLLLEYASGRKSFVSFSAFSVFISFKKAPDIGSDIQGSWCYLRCYHLVRSMLPNTERTTRSSRHR